MPALQPPETLDFQVRPFFDLPCVGGKLYLGSMFFLDFGGRFLGKARNGATIEIGHMTLSVRDVAWWLYHRGDLRGSFEEVDEAQFEAVVGDMLGAKLKRIAAITDERRLHIDLTNAWLLAIDITNQLQTESEIVELALPDGRLIGIAPNGLLVPDIGRDEERTLRWLKTRE